MPRKKKKKEKKVKKEKQELEEGLEEQIEEVSEDVSEDMFSDFMQPVQAVQSGFGWGFSEIEAPAPVLSRAEIPDLEQDIAGTETSTSSQTPDRAPALNYAPASATDYATRGLGMEEEFRKYQMGEAPLPVLMPETDIRGFRPELLDPREQMGIRHQAGMEPRTLDRERVREKNGRRRLPFEGEDIEKKYREVKL